LILIITVWLAYSKGYRKRYVIPKREAHEKKLEEVLAIYNDVTNISRFLVLHRGSGIAIFDSMGERGRDGSLIGGFLQAIQAFSIDVNEEQRPTDQAQLSEITYEGFRVLINDGQHVRTAIVYRGTPSETLRQKLELFTKRFETDYQNELLKHGHEPRRFENANELLEEVFHISLLFPHEVVTVTSDIQLTNLESRLHFIALELNKQRKSIYLSEIVNKYLETINENPVELLNAIFQLREKQLIIPVTSSNSI
jgi:predicted DNA-binding protein